MNEKTLRVLEFHKVLDLLREETSSPLTEKVAEELRPSSVPFQISEELRLTEEAFTVLLKKGAPPFGKFFDIGGVVRLAAKGATLTMKQLLEVAYNMSSARMVGNFLSTDLPPLPGISALTSAITVMKNLEEEITRCIISEDEMADSASPELRRIRRGILKHGEAIKSKLQSIVSSAANRHFLQDAIITVRQGRYVIPVKQEYKGSLPGIIHDQSASGATLFIEPQTIVNMNNELRELELAEEKEMARILAELSAEVGSREAAIRGNQEILVKLDFIFAKGRLAAGMKAFRPEINEKGRIDIKAGRHPLIDKDKIVPIDVQLGGDYNTLVVTGPNTGGKTVTLKTVGLLCLMAQSGLFIPASEGSTLPVFSGIYADIGDEQSIEQSLSTFSSHMKNIVNITSEAGEGSLVLLDELGAGTDPTEGAALAISILEHLISRGASTIATTHYTELKKYALTAPGVNNASMEFDVETLSPTFRLITGAVGKSNAFEISAKLGLAADIIEHASTLLERGDIRFEDVLSAVEKDRKAAEKDRDEALMLKLSLQERLAEAGRAEEKARERRERLLEKARGEALGLVQEARVLVEEVQTEAKLAVREAREAAEAEYGAGGSKTGGKTGGGIKGPAGERILRLRRLVSEKERAARRGEIREALSNPAPLKAEDVEVGMRVNILAAGQKANVLTLPDDRGDLQVQAGSIKLSVNLAGLSAVQENVTPKQKERIKTSRIHTAKAKSVPISLNLIGKRLSEAEHIADKYLDDAVLAGLSEVSIIHGKGEGILKSGLTEMFKTHRHVMSFRGATPEEGGGGVTIVKLRQ